MSATASHTQFKTEVKTSKILRSNKVLLHYLAKMHKSLKFIAPVKWLVPELFKYPTPLCQWDSKIYHPAQKTACSSLKLCVTSCNTQLFYFEELWPPPAVHGYSIITSAATVNICRTRHAVLRRTTGHWHKVSLKKYLKFCNPKSQ